MLLLQLPPFLKADLPLLSDFLSGLPKAGRFSFEFRHASWFSEQIYDILRQANAALCLAENEKLETPSVVISDFCYYRLRKPEYSADERQRYKETFRQQLEQGRD